MAGLAKFSMWSCDCNCSPNLEIHIERGLVEAIFDKHIYIYGSLFLFLGPVE